jgi:hypothetical protein
MRQAKNILWDYGEEEENGTALFLGLPDHADIPDHVKDEDIADWLSDTYEFCVYSFDVERM